MRRFLFLAALLLLLSWPLQAQDVVAEQPDTVSQTVDVQADNTVDAVEGDVVLTAITVDVEAPAVPDASIGDAISSLMEATKDGGTLHIVSAAIFLILCVFRNKAAKAFLNRFLPTRWLSVVAVALGVLWAVLAHVEALGWWGAISEGLLAGGGAVAMYEVLARAILNKDKNDA